MSSAAVNSRDEPPFKRRRPDSSDPHTSNNINGASTHPSLSPAPTLSSSDPRPASASFHCPIHPPSRYERSNPTAFQQPMHLTSFSYSPTRELLLEPETRDASLAVYSPPRIGADFNQGFEQAVWRDGSVDEGLDALLDTLDYYAENDTTGVAEDVLSKVSVITWRGMMTKLMLAVYEAESASSGRRKADGWEMNAMVLDGTLYLEESNSPTKLGFKAASEQSYLRQSYYGYSFEAFSTRPPSSNPSDPHTFEPPNTNVQWCSIVKTNLGGFRSILGGEVDCLRPEWRKEDGIKTGDFVELKTNIVIGNQRDEMMFERQKLLKHYTQSFLLGVPTITVGFRTRPGQLAAVQSFGTLEIPRLVRGKPHAWSPQISLKSAHSLLTFIHSTMSSHPSNRCAEDEFASSGKSEEWPVFRLTFSPRAEGEKAPGLEVRLTREDEVRDEVLGGKKEEVRVGFLLKRWVEGVRRRRMGAAAP